MIGKYVEKLLTERTTNGEAQSRINPVFLAENGFL